MDDYENSHEIKESYNTVQDTIQEQDRGKHGAWEKEGMPETLGSRSLAPFIFSRASLREG